MIKTTITTIIRWATIGCAIDTAWSALKEMGKRSPGDVFFNKLCNRKKKDGSPIILPPGK